MGLSQMYERSWQNRFPLFILCTLFKKIIQDTFDASYPKKQTTK
jgi:hypothetical protein